MNFLRNRPLVIAIITIVLIAFLMIGTASSDALSGAASAPAGALVPLQKFFYGISDNIYGFFAGADKDSLAQAAALQTELDQLKMTTADYSEIAAENERLSAMLEYKQNNPNQELKVAKVTGKEPGNWFQVFTIDLGAKDGIQENMAVLTPDGLVGRVEEVGLSWSKVLTLIDGRSKVSCIVERTRDIGVAEGAVGTDPTSATLKMNYLPSDTDVVEGDAIITSGLDGLFPKGLVLGSVSAASSGSSGVNVTVKPGVDFRRLEEVFVLVETQSATSNVNENIADGNAVITPIETETPSGGPQEPETPSEAPTALPTATPDAVSPSPAQGQTGEN